MTFILPGGIGQLRPASVMPLSTLDPNRKHAWISLSNNNMSATGGQGGVQGTGTPVSVIATPSGERNSGKLYFEVSFNMDPTASPNWTLSVGLVAAAGWAPSPTSFIGGDGTGIPGVVMGQTGWRVYRQGSPLGNTSYLGGYQICVAVDFNYSGGVAFYFAENNRWIQAGSTTFDPASYSVLMAGLGGNPSLVPVTPALSISYSYTMTYINTPQTVYWGPPPGFSMWG